jgi:DNA repair exonuclease SbcCD ATPase subunit
MGHANNTINLLRNGIAEREAEIEKLATQANDLQALADAQAALITANTERERLLLQIIANALAALDRDASGSARFHLLAARAHPRLEELAAQIETAQTAIARALPFAELVPAEPMGESMGESMDEREIMLAEEAQG